MTRSLSHKIGYFLEYLTKERGFVRSFPLPYLPNYRRPYPETLGIAVDLHCHLHIENPKQLKQIIKRASKNRVDLLGHTIHVGSNEEDYWEVKDLALNEGIITEEGDKGLAFITQKPYELTFVGSYETQGVDPKTGLRLDVLALMPNKGLEKYIEREMLIDDFLALAKEFQAIPLIAHLCVLPTGKFIAYRSPTGREIQYIKKEILPKFSGSDEVSDAAAWMTYSWEQSEKNLGETLRSSDAHTNVTLFNKVPLVSQWIRWYLVNEIGRAWTEFPELFIRSKDGIQIRRELLEQIKGKKYRGKGEFTPAGQFFLGTALPII